MKGSDDAPLVTVEDLRIEVGADGESRVLLDDVNLTVQRGEVLAIVGESGSGKSLTSRAVVGLLPRGLRASGRVMLEGQDLIAADERARRRVRGRDVALVLQDPFTTLNPLMKCRTQIVPVGGARQPRAEQRSEAVRRLAEVGIRDPDVADRYPWQLSGGMRQRVALAAALANDPKLLVADEFSTALDVTTQKEIWLLLRRIQKARGMGLVIITHDLRMAFSMCDRVCVMYAGSLVETGAAGVVEEQPLHPYTLGLLRAEPDVTTATGGSLLMPGSVPRADEVTHVCAFTARCLWSTEACVEGKPPLVPVGEHRETACVRIDEIQSDMAALRQLPTNGELAVAYAPTTRTSDAPVVVIRDLHKVFVGGRRHATETGVVALAGVSLEVGAGESVGLVGESGSGKTTLARCLVGLETPSSGSIEIAGLEVTHPERLSRHDRARLPSLVQYVFQDPYSSLNPTKTIGATLTEAIAVRLGSDRRAVARRLSELLSLVGLPTSYTQRKPLALSGGERQRVAIARALALEPRVVICDEPVSALDVSVQAQVLELFADIRRETGVSYLFITHDLAVVRQAAERIYVLYRGKIVEHGPVVELLEHPRNDYTRALLAAVPGQWDRDSGAPIFSA